MFKGLIWGIVCLRSLNITEDMIKMSTWSVSFFLNQTLHPRILRKSVLHPRILTRLLMDTIMHPYNQIPNRYMHPRSQIPNAPSGACVKEWEIQILVEKPRKFPVLKITRQYWKLHTQFCSKFKERRISKHE